MARNRNATSPACAGRVSFVLRSTTVQPASSRVAEPSGPGSGPRWSAAPRPRLRRRRASLPASSGLGGRAQRNVTVGPSVASGADRHEPVAVRPRPPSGSTSAKESANRALTKWMTPGTLRKFSVRRSRPSGGNSPRQLAEDRRLRPAEPVDRLLGVAHDEHPAAGRTPRRRAAGGSRSGSGRCPGTRRPGRTRPARGPAPGGRDRSTSPGAGRGS